MKRKMALHLPLLLQMNNLSMPIPQGESSAQKPTHKRTKITKNKIANVKATN
jgi:hypothetical protein